MDVRTDVSPSSTGRLSLPASARLTTSVIARHWALLVAMSVGVATAFFRLGAKGLWGDEVWTVSWGFPQPFYQVRSPVDFPILWASVHLTTSAFSQTEFWVRFPEAAFGAATVVLVYLVGRRLFDLHIGIVAALLVAAAPYHVWISQDAKPLSGLAFFPILSLYFVVALLQDGLSAARVIGFIVAACLNILNHFVGLLPLSAEMLAAVLWMIALTRLNRSLQQNDLVPPVAYLTRLGAILGGGLLALIVASPLLIGAVSYLLSPGGSGKGAAITAQSPGTILVDVFAQLGTGHGWTFWAMSVLAILGLVSMLYRRRWLAVNLLLTWLAVAVLVLLLIPTYHLFDARYVIFLQPVYLLIIACGLAEASAVLFRAIQPHLLSIPSRDYRIIRNTIFVAPVICALAVVFTPTWESYWIEKVNDWSSVCSFLHKTSQPGEIVTGDSYYLGIMIWCFSSPLEDVNIVPLGNKSLPELTDMSQSVMYINIDPNVSVTTLLQAGYQPIARSAWARQDLVGSTTDPIRMTFPQAEWPVTLYQHVSNHAPSTVSFDVPHPNKPDPVSYAQITPAGHVEMTLELPATSPRVVRIVFFGLLGRDLDIAIDRKVIAHIKATGSWSSVEVPVPNTTADSFVFELRNPGTDVSALSEADVAYAK